MKVLEIGPDKIPTTLQDISHVPEVDPSLDIQILANSEYGYPVADAAHDIVVVADVLEHVHKPWVWMRELARVTKPGGYVVTIDHRIRSKMDTPGRSTEAYGWKQRLIDSCLGVIGYP